MSRDFLTIATEMAMLTPETVENLSQEAARSGESIETLVARKGLLSAVQMDIVQTLLRPNEIVPGYEVLSVIGHGGMGVVYRARQKTLDRVVAIKTILISQVGDPNMAARFENEARAVARLQHPNIINAIDFGQHDGRLFFVMEFVVSEDLETLIERRNRQWQEGAPSEEFAWGLARQAASGLAHAAEQGIVHRDVKPANLLLVEPPAGFPLPAGMPLVKIADFGLAFLSNEGEAKSRLTAANTTVGSPHYMAPEQLGGKPVDGRADIYALGATVFHLLAGKPPYSGLTLTQILTQKMTADAPWLRTACSTVSDETDSLIADMMASRPEGRIVSYAELLHRIDRHFGNTTTSLGMATSPGTATARTPATLSATANFATIAPQQPPKVSAAAFAVTAKIDVQKTESPENQATLVMPLPTTNPFMSSSDNRSEVGGGHTEFVLSPRDAGRWSRRKILTGMIATTLTVAAGATAWLTFGRHRNQTPSVPQLKPSGWGEQLFDGRSVFRTWKPRSGTWVLAEDEEGAKVLAGTNGVVSRPLLRSDVQPPLVLEHFQLTMAVRLNKASAVELHFGILRTADGDGIRLAIRLESESARLVRRASDRAKWEPISEPISLSPTSEQARVIQLIRDATNWFVLVDQQTIGTLALSEHTAIPEFRLLAEGGPAWFSDVEVQELMPPLKIR